MRDLLGNAYTSKPTYTSHKKIGAQDWVDALYPGSEIPGFTTRYVASIKEKIAALITYSIADSMYPKWSPIMDQMLNSVELTFDPKAFEADMNSDQSSLIGARRGAKGIRGLSKGGDAVPPPTKPDSGIDPTQIGGGILLLAIIAYFIYKKRKG